MGDAPVQVTDYDTAWRGRLAKQRDQLERAYCAAPLARPSPSPTTPSTASPTVCGSTDLERAGKVAEQLVSGTVWINDWHNLYGLLPYGG
jgi:hypothetical protein